MRLRAFARSFLSPVSLAKTLRRPGFLTAGGLSPRGRQPSTSPEQQDVGSWVSSHEEWERRGFVEDRPSERLAFLWHARGEDQRPCFVMSLRNPFLPSLVWSWLRMSDKVPGGRDRPVFWTRVTRVLPLGRVLANDMPCSALLLMTRPSLQRSLISCFPVMAGIGCAIKHQRTEILRVE